MDFSNLVQPPVAVLQRRTPQIIPPCTWTALAWDFSVVDTDAGHDSAAATRWTPPIAGLYHSDAEITIPEPSHGMVDLEVRVVGARGMRTALHLSESMPRGRRMIEFDEDDKPTPWFAKLSFASAVGANVSEGDQFELWFRQPGPEEMIVPPNPSDCWRIMWVPS